MVHIDQILQLRSIMPAYDEQLWAFMDRRAGRNLENVSATVLQDRLKQIEKNILYLDSGATPRDSLPADRGWLSPWWWLRARYWTLLEFERRDLTPEPSAQIPAMPALAEGFKGVMAGGKKLLVRLSKEAWLIDLLRGRLRFAPAAIYRDLGRDDARSDEEMIKAYRRPAQAIEITDLQGTKIEAIGDVAFATRRSLERDGVLKDTPYWFCSFSSDLDPRLFREFTESDACIVIFDPGEFVRRALPHLNRIAPDATKSLFPNDYFDPYFLGNHKLNAMASKEMAFAYQREMRFSIDPEGGPPLADGDLYVDIGSLEDIAAVYAGCGEKISGAGPEFFMN
jgi:hypothetical protein